VLPLISRPCAIVAGGGDSHALHALGLLAMSAIVSDPDSKESIAPVRTTSVRMYAIPTHCPNRGEYAADTISRARTSPLRNFVPGITDEPESKRTGVRILDAALRERRRSTTS
jgi:hypothetical protein